MALLSPDQTIGLEHIIQRQLLCNTVQKSTGDRYREVTEKYKIRSCSKKSSYQSLKPSVQIQVDIRIRKEGLMSEEVCCLGWCIQSPFTSLLKTLPSSDVKGVEQHQHLQKGSSKH